MHSELAAPASFLSPVRANRTLGIFCSGLCDLSNTLPGITSRTAGSQEAAEKLLMTWRTAPAIFTRWSPPGTETLTNWTHFIRFLTLWMFADGLWAHQLKNICSLLIAIHFIWTVADILQAYQLLHSWIIMDVVWTHQLTQTCSLLYCDSLRL